MNLEPLSALPALRVAMHVVIRPAQLHHVWDTRRTFGQVMLRRARRGLERFWRTRPWAARTWEMASKAATISSLGSWPCTRHALLSATRLAASLPGLGCFSRDLTQSQSQCKVQIHGAPMQLQSARRLL